MGRRTLKGGCRPATILAIAGFALTLWSTSCGGGGGSVVVPVSTAGFSISTAAISFGSQAVNTTSAAQSATLINVGNAALTFTSIEVTGANAGDFNLTNACGASLAPSAQCTLSLTFTPTAAGTRNASVVFADNADGSPQSVNVTGTGTAANLGLSAGTLTFGSQLVGTTSAAQTVTLTNSGNAALTFNSISVTGASAAAFPETTTCGSSLAAQAACTISISFFPSAGGAQTAAVTITDSAPGSPQTVTLSGTGTNATASLSSNSIPFGNQNLGTTSAAQSVTLTNNGSSSLSIASISMVGASPGDFNETNTCGVLVAAGGNCSISVTFTPASAGAAGASVMIADNAPGSPQTITLSGTGVGTSAVGSFSVSSLTFGSQSLNTASAPSPIILTNTGNVTLTYTPPFAITGTNAANFGESDNCGGSVVAGASCTINVVFTPSADGVRAASLTLISNATNSPQSVALSGTGTSSTVSLSASTLTFASQVVGTTSAAQPVVLSNTGNVAVTINGLSVGGANASDFSPTNTCGTSLAANGTCTISVTFTPSAPGTRTASVSIADSATGSPQTIGLTGTGSGPAVTLTSTSLTFTTQNIGTPSAARPVTLSNTGNAALSITGIAFTGANGGDFAQLNTCGTSVAAGTSCTISVTFTPGGPGTRTGSLGITDNAAGSPQTVSLTGTGNGPVVNLSVPGLSYSSQSIGSSGSPQTFTINNTGNSALMISSIQLTGPNAGDFSETNTCGSSVAAGASCTVTVTFTPTAPGTRTASLTITDNSNNSPQTLSLSGTASGPEASVSVPSLTFNNQNIGTTSGAQGLILSNTGNASLAISNISFAGANPSDFVQTNTCGSAVSAGGTCTISVTFAPTGAGSRTASLVITDNSNDAGGSQQTVSLSGTGSGPSVSLSPSSLIFGSQTQGATSPSQSVTLTNIGTTTLILTGISVGGTNAGDFAETNTCGGVVTVNSSCAINVTFTPSGTGGRAAALNFADNASGSPQAVTLVGTGLAPGQINISPSSLNFSFQGVGTTSNAQSVGITNSGTTSFTLGGITLTGADPGDFSQTNSCPGTLVQNASCTSVVKFTPAAIGVRQALLSIADSLASSPQVVALTGVGSGAGAFISPTLLTFAPINPGTTSSPQSATLTNNGTASLIISGISTGGANPGDFTVLNTCGGSVAPNSSCTFTVAFSPAAIGSRTATVSIADNAGGTPQVLTLTGTGSGPIAGASPSSLAFNVQSVGTTSSAQTVTLTNSGNTALSVTGLAFSGANAVDFAYTTTCGSSLAANTSCAVNVTFTPSAIGSRTATLTITDNTNNAPGTQQTVSLTGTGSGPSVSFSPSSLSFAGQTLNSTSAAQAVTLSNNGNGNLTVSSLTLTGTNAGDFSQTNNCGSSVGAGASCTINVTFTPTALGNRTASISVTDNASGSPQTVAMTGAGTASVASLNTTSLTYGNQAVNTTSAPQTVMLTNTGNATLSITSITVGGTNSSDFFQSNTCGNSVAANASCAITVTFTPSAVGNRSASITLADSASGSPQTVTLSGVGTGAVANLSALALSFNSQGLGTPSSPQTITVNNTGNLPLSFSSVVVSGANGGDFVQTNTCGSPVAAGSSCAVNVTFTPSAPGSRVATLTFTDNAAGSPQSVSLSGTGTGPVASLSASSLSFLSQNLGTTSAVQTLTLSNSGNAPLSVANMALTGTNPGDFAQTNTCGSSMAASSSCTISVTFTPVAPGPRTATLAVTDNSNNVAGSVQAASLTGTGTGAAVSLSPPSLTFTSQTLGTTSVSQSVTLTNTGNVSLTISGISVTGANAGDFAETNTCPATLTAGVDCTVTVTFTPAGVGSRSAAVSVVDSGLGSPQSIGLSGTGSGPVVSLSPSSLTFASQAVGTTSGSQTITVNNPGNAPLNIGTVALTGANAGDFAQSSNCGSPVAAGSSCAITVTFSPTAFGSRSASVAITDNAAGSPQSVGVTGTGSAPSASLTTAGLTFASQNVGTTSAGQPITLNNTGNAALNISGIAISGANAADFAQSNNCGSSLAASSGCTITVTFTPSAPATRTATVSVTDNSNNVAGSIQIATLSGAGSGPLANLSTSTLGFGSQAQSTTGSGQSVTLTNNGNATLTITNVAITGTNSGDFTISANTCGGSVAASANCSITVTYSPAVIGAESASLNFTDTAPLSPQAVSLTGTGIAGQVTFAPPSIVFGNQNVGTTSGVMSTTITNTGSASFTVNSISITGANAGDFSQTNNCGGSLGVGANCTVSVKFSPTTAGTRVAAISVADSLTGSPQTASLTGTGFAPEAVVGASSLTFAAQNVGTASTGKSFTINDTGNSTLNFASITFTGANPGDFSQTNTCGVSIGSTGSCTVTVTFAPTGPGSRSATLVITDNNNNVAGAMQTVSLSGTGNAPTAGLSGSSLSFTAQNVGTTSAAQGLTVSNTGNIALTLSGIGFAGTNPADFAQTNTCGGSVAANSNCTISITFTPSAPGSRTATLNITDNTNNLVGSQQSVTLTGTGNGAIATLNPASLNFNSQPQGTASAPTGSTITNNGNTNLTITSITVTGTNAGDFSQTNTCVSPVLPNGTCTINVVFTPGGILSRTASISIADNAPGSPQVLTVSGNGTSPIAGTTLSSLTFTGQNVNTTSSAQGFTLNNSGNVPLTISGVSFGGTNPGDFAQTNTCGGSVAATSSCTFSVTFTPAGQGSRAATLVITDNSNNAAGSQQSITLSGTGNAPVAGVSPGSIGFNNQTLNVASAAQSFTLNNTGNVPLTISGISFTGTNPGDFGQTNTCGSSVAANGSCTVNVTFTPTVIGSRSASVTITDNNNNTAGSQQSVTLTGTGTSPIVSLSGTTLNFNPQTVGTTSALQPITLTNTGNVALTLTSISVTGANAGDFAQTNTCSGTVAANGGFCTINVTFTPTAILNRAASISIVDNAPASPQTVSLTGTGTASIATLSKTSVTFASQTQLTSSSPQTFTLTNTGNVSLTISSIALSGANTGDFSQTNTCPISPATLGAGSSCSMSVTFTPTATGSRAATATFTDNATPGAGTPSPQAVSLSGTGVLGSVGLSTSTIPFGSQSVGTTSGSQIVQLTNGGSSSLAITSILITGTNPGDFNIASNTCVSPVVVNGTCNVEITFAPTTAGSRSATVTFTDSASNSPQTVTLTGTGSAPEGGLTPATFGYPNTPGGEASSSQTFVLSNNGNLTLNIANISFTGTNPGDFSDTTTCLATLSASSTCNVVVTFTPQASGSRSANLVVTDNSNNVTGSTQSSTLSGTGLHDVYVTWTASPTSGILGYNIYRGTSSGGEGTTPINTSPVTVTNYADMNVTVGATYYYVVTAVAANGTTQSPDSNEASATVP